MKFTAAVSMVLVGFFVERSLPFLHIGGVSLPLVPFLVAAWILPLTLMQRIVLVLIGGILLDAVSIFSFPVHTLTLLVTLFFFHGLFLGPVDTKSRFFGGIGAPCFVFAYFFLLLITILLANKVGLLPEISSIYPSLVLGVVFWVVAFLGTSAAVAGLKYVLLR